MKVWIFDLYYHLSLIFYLFYSKHFPVLSQFTYSMCQWYLIKWIRGGSPPPPHPTFMPLVKVYIHKDLNTTNTFPALIWISTKNILHNFHQSHGGSFIVTVTVKILSTPSISRSSITKTPLKWIHIQPLHQLLFIFIITI